MYDRVTVTRGFTLIEMMVSVALFSMVMLAGMAALLTLVNENRKAQALNSVMTDLNFTLESVTRTIRTGYDIDCIGAGADCPNGQNQIQLTDQNGATVTYRFDATNGGRLERNGSPLTSQNVVIDTGRSRFYVTGAEDGESGDTEQPVVRITLVGTATVGQESVDFALQTTTTQRRIDL